MIRVFTLKVDGFHGFIYCIIGYLFSRFRGLFIIHGVQLHESDIMLLDRLIWRFTEVIEESPHSRHIYSHIYTSYTYFYTNLTKSSESFFVSECRSNYFVH